MSTKIEELCIEISRNNEIGEDLMDYIQQMKSFDGYFLFYVNDTEQSFKEIVNDAIDVSIDCEVKKLIDYKYNDYILINTETEDYIMASDNLIDIFTYIFDNYHFTKEEEKSIVCWIIDNIWQIKLFIESAFEVMIE